jgi:taurine dioxygenase
MNASSKAATALPLAGRIPTAAGLTVKPLTGQIGAEIEGVNAREPVAPEVGAELNALLNQWKVIFLRDQPVTPEQHIAFAGTFGPVIRDYAAARDADHMEIQKIRGTYGNVNKWHTDTSWMVRPAKCAVLHGIVVPEVGGDTMWADGVAAYQGLPEEIKERIQDLDCIHDPSNIGKSYGKDDPEYAARQQRRRDIRKQHPLVAQPIVRTHPETGEKTLFLNENLCTWIVGLPPQESDELLAYLLREYQRPEYTVRFRWQPHSIAIWDQRQTQHTAINDYPVGTPRHLERILVAGDDVPHR